KVAILNFVSPTETFSDYVIDELTGKLVTGRKVTIVDRKNLALISQEMKLQLSGDVSDESAQAIGRMLGAQSIVSGNLTNMGTFYRIRIRVINVETAAIQTQISLDLRNDAQVAFLLSGAPTSTPPTVPSGTAAGISANETATPLTEGTMVPGNNLTEKLTWLDRNADSHNTYILVVNANENIAPYMFNYSGAINITVALRGDGQNRTIRLRTNGTMFTVSANITFILENNVTLQGHNGNSTALVYINGGTLKMRTGSTITGNTDKTVGSSRDGGAIDISGGIFEMTGGTISGNTAYDAGGGVYILSGTFTMSGGIISGNTALKGGGVHISSGTFNMRGGTITGNTARENGGGVYAGSTFAKTGGTITGYNTDQVNGNAVKDEAGNTLARRGHAVFRNDNQRKETTAGTSVNLSSNDSGRWD
ncbi:CsgG/HfaB family protein, partial [Treponema sp. R80B11-R83G3]